MKIELRLILRTIEITINENLIQRLEQAAQLAEVPFSEFVQQLLRGPLREWTLYCGWLENRSFLSSKNYDFQTEQSIEELEQQEIAAYQRLPVTPGEFDLWETENHNYSFIE